MAYLYRRATTEDVEHLVHHRVAMWRDMGKDEQQVRDSEAVSREYFTKAVAEGTFIAWLVEAEGQVIAGGGVAILPWPGHPGTSKPRRAMILNMYTEAEYRRKGIARQLMHTMVDWCRAEGFSSVGLHASEEGRPLYASLGFVPTEEMRLKL